MRRFAKMPLLPSSCPCSPLGPRGGSSRCPPRRRRTAVPSTFALHRRRLGPRRRHEPGTARYGMATEGASADDDPHALLHRHHGRRRTTTTSDIRVNLAHRSRRREAPHRGARRRRRRRQRRPRRHRGRRQGRRHLRPEGVGHQASPSRRTARRRAQPCPSVVVPLVRHPRTRAPRPATTRRRPSLNLVGTDAARSPPAATATATATSRSSRAPSSGVTQLEVVNVAAPARRVPARPRRGPVVVAEGRAAGAGHRRALVRARQVRARASAAAASATSTPVRPYSDQNFVGYVEGVQLVRLVVARRRHRDERLRRRRRRPCSTRASRRRRSTAPRPAAARRTSRTCGAATVPYLISVDDHWSTQKKYNPTYAAWGPYDAHAEAGRDGVRPADVVELDLSRALRQRRAQDGDRDLRRRARRPRSPPARSSRASRSPRTGCSAPVSGSGAPRPTRP